MIDKTSAGENSMMGFRDYLLIAKRRILLVSLTAMAIIFAATVVIHRMPNLYRAETTILVDPQQVPNSYVPSTVSTSISDRLATIHQEITSPSRLKRLMDTTGLFAEMRKNGSEDEVIAMMQRAITVQIVEQGGRGFSVFKVGFSGQNPEEVANVANQLASLFISENLKVRERQSYGTAEFLDAELKRTKEDLDQKADALNEVKGKYMLDLPDSKQYHLEMLTSLRAEYQGSEDRVSQAQQQKVYLASTAVTQAPTVDMDSNRVSSVYGPQVEKIEGQLSSLKSHYGDRHPDVRKAQSELDDLKAKEKAAQKEGAVDAPPVIKEASDAARAKNPVVAAQIAKLDEDIEKERKKQQLLQQQINFHVSKLEKIPIFEQRISGMMMDYDSLRAHYGDLKNKKLAADMSSALETHEQAERFEVLDKAAVPTEPYAPKRSLLLLAALAAGIMAGLGLAIAKEIADDAVYLSSDMTSLLGDTPVLVEVPAIRTSGEVIGHRLRWAGAFLSTGVVSVALGFAISWFMNA